MKNKVGEAIAKDNVFEARSYVRTALAPVQVRKMLRKKDLGI